MLWCPLFLLPTSVQSLFPLVFQTNTGGGKLWLVWSKNTSLLAFLPKPLTSWDVICGYLYVRGRSQLESRYLMPPASEHVPKIRVAKLLKWQGTPTFWVWPGARWWLSVWKETSRDIWLLRRLFNEHLWKFSDFPFMFWHCFLPRLERRMNVLSSYSKFIDNGRSTECEFCVPPSLQLHFVILIDVR